MIKKGLKLWVNVGKNSLKLRKLMAEHLESMGIDGEKVSCESYRLSYVTLHEKYTKSIDKKPWNGWGKEITVAEFFNLTEADLLEPKRTPCRFYTGSEGNLLPRIAGDYTQDQIDRVLAILKEGES